MNNSAEDIVYIISNQGDTTLERMELIKDELQYDALTVKANSFIEIESNWINSLKLIDTSYLFVFSKEAIINTPWDQIESDYMILKRYDLSFSDVENMNWIITYPLM